MRKIIPALLFAMAAVLPAIVKPAIAQEVTCYKKVCAEYPNGSKFCELTPVDCSQIQIQ
jgi:hypothetical protein